MHASTPLILRKSRMRRRARTDLCGGRSVMVVPTATKANSPLAPERGHEVSVVGTQQENLCPLGMRQMQSAKHSHIGPTVFGMIGIQDCDLHTRGGDCVEH